MRRAEGSIVSRLRRPVVFALSALVVSCAGLHVLRDRLSVAPAGAAPAPLVVSASALAVEAPAIRFVAMGDTGKGNRGQREVASAVEKKCARDGCDFVLLLGDNVYESGPSADDDVLFTERFEEPYRALSMPFYPVVGNHDCGGRGLGHDLERTRHEIAYTARSSKWKMPGRYYALQYPGVDLVALDTNTLMFSADPGQREAVRGWLAGSKATWRIAFGHHPYLSNGPHGNAGSYGKLPTFTPIVPGQGVKAFLDETICGQSDVYISAHDHSRQWLEETCGGTELVVSGAGATTTKLPGRNRARFQALTLGFLYVKIAGKTLTAEFVDEEGETEFVRELQK